jgi:fatty acid desaturase
MNSALVGEPLMTVTRELHRAIKDLSRVSTTVAVYHILEIWLVIAMAVYVSVVLAPIRGGIGGVFLYMVAVAVIASRQHALMVLTHDGIHKRLSRRLWTNDGLARLAAFPVFISLAKWRFIHLHHHQYTHTADDPDRAIYARYPLTKQRFFRLLLQDICGKNVISTLKYFIDIPFLTKEFNRRFLGEVREVQYREVADMKAFVLFWSVVVGGGLYWGGTWAVMIFVLYWLVPYCTLTQVFFRIRGAIEHGNIPDPHHPYLQTRTYLIVPILAFFFSPKQVNYHLEHHLYPSVPFYNLPHLHILLRQRIYPHEGGYYEPFVQSLHKLIRE